MKRLKKRLRNLSIRRKLFFVIGLTTTLALVLAFIAFMINHVFIFSQKQKNKLEILAQVLASNSEAAVAFNDKPAGEEVLNALEAEPHIVAAAIYDGNGRLFATYKTGIFPQRIPNAPVNRPLIIYKNFLYHVVSPIYLQGKSVGVIYLQSDLRELFEILETYLIAGLLIILLCACVSLLIASWLQKDISDPVMKLSSLAKRVSTSKDYSIRARKISNDEIGNLMDSFNEMLSEIQKRDEALTRSNSDLEQFAYVASHDLQEPLRMVSSYTDLLSDAFEGKLEGSEKEYMAFLKEGAARASTLIRDLLEYSRARAQPKAYELVRMEEVLNEALRNLKVKIEETGAMISHDALPEVRGDRLKLTLLLQNLIGNAMKFTQPDTAPKIHVSVRERQDSWLFSIQDNGIGIDPQYRERIFVIFQRLHHRRAYEGTGIGLAICKTIVENHGGKIWVEANPDGGSVFSFTFPFQQASAGGSPPA